MSDAILERLAQELREAGGLLAAAVRERAATDGAVLGARAAAGPRGSTAPGDYALLVEAIHEGYLLHYGRGRVLDDHDPDLALLAGDALYALGLARLARLGDLPGILAMAEVNARCARLHAEGRPQETAAVWQSGAAAAGGA